MPYRDKEKARECGRECARRYQLAHPEKVKEYKRRYRLRHREELLEYSWRFQLKHKELGLCIDCGRPAVGGVRCALHNDQRNRRGRRNYRQNPEVRAKRAAYRKERYYRLKSEGKCASCGKPLGDYFFIGIHCVNCYKKKGTYCQY